MCSTSDIEYDGVMLMDKVEQSDKIGIWCRKCTEKTTAQVILRKKDPYCKKCFLTSVNHKFRACLGKSKSMRPGDKVLIGFSGSTNSAALLHLIQTGLQETSNKKLMFEPFITYIDESSVLNLTLDEQEKLKKDTNEALAEYEYPTYIVPIELCLETEEAVDEYLTGGSFKENGNTLKEVFCTLTDVSSKMDLLNKLRHSLLARIAKSLGCNKVFTAESADDLAVKLLTNVSLGRGAQLPYDVGFSDDRFIDTSLLRPLRDISKKELVFYNFFHGLASVHVPSFLTKVNPHSSIHRLTESFLNELHEGFPSTLSTVFRVADKLTTNPGDSNSCPLCQAPLGMNDKAPSSMNATQFSRLVSSLGPSGFETDGLKELHLGPTCSDDVPGNSCCGSGLCSSKTIEKELQETLCYGCNLILKDGDIRALPDELMKYIRESSQRSKMKKEIEEFLL